MFILHFHRRPLLITCAVLLVVTFIFWRECEHSPQGHLAVHFFDVGQGDSALLVSPSGRTILIDSGPDFSAIEQLGKILPLADRSIDLLILSHPDPDHFTAFGEILRRYEVGALLLPPTKSTEPQFLALLAIARERRVPLIIADPTHDLEFGDGLTLDFLWPRTSRSAPVRGEPLSPLLDDNDGSIVLRASYGTGSILFAGDISEQAERMILARGIDVSATVLKVSHHGSKTATSLAFLSAVHPHLAVISVGKENHYRHPSPETMERLSAAGIPVRTTAEEGTIDLVF